MTKVTLNEVAHSIFYAPQYVALENGYFPKISIQMLVENAIIHGMPENGAVLHIIIRVCMENNRLLISVYDDGKGILPEK